MTDKETLFVKEYLVDLNATQAAIRAGYSKNSAKEIGCQNLTKLHVQEAVQKAMEKRNERVQITQDEVLRDLQEVKDRCLQRIAVRNSNGEETGEYQFKENGALKALELLGKHLAMFTDKVDVKGMSAPVPPTKIVINGKLIE